MVSWTQRIQNRNSRKPLSVRTHPTIQVPGTHGYASTLEAPQLSAAIDALAVTPIAPFVTKTSRWVLPDDGVRLTVERDEGPIQVVADEHASATISIDGAVTVSVTDTLSTLVVPEDALESHA